jgi:cell division protein FtsB
MRLVLALLLLIFIGLQYRLWIGPGSWAHVAALNDEFDQQQAVNQSLKDRNNVLEADVKDLKNGMGGVEERARSELGLIKKGETFYLLIDKND